MAFEIQRGVVLVIYIYLGNVEKMCAGQATGLLVRWALSYDLRFFIVLAYEIFREQDFECFFFFSNDKFANFFINYTNF